MKTHLIGLGVLLAAATAGLSMDKSAPHALPGAVAAASAAPRTSSALPSIPVIAPVFSQIILMSQPAEFKVVEEATTGDRYARAAVRADQSLEDWTDLVSLIGGKGLASNPEATPIAIAEAIADGLQRSCPKSFSAKPLGGTKFGKFEAFLAIAACGTVNAEKGPRSEASLIIAIRGSQDFYSLQWIERGPAFSTTPAIDEQKWLERYKRIGPIWLCDTGPDEAAAKAKCIGGK